MKPLRMKIGKAKKKKERSEKGSVLSTAKGGFNNPLLRYALLANGEKPATTFELWFPSESPKATKVLAEVFAAFLKEISSNPQRKNPVVISLIAPLGAGKTTFIKFLARSLGVKKKLTSPTFVLWRTLPFSIADQRRFSKSRINADRIRQNPRLDQRESEYLFHHIDAYRLNSPQELAALGFEKILHDPRNIVLVEWGDRVASILPKDRLEITISIINKKKRLFVVAAPQKNS